MKRITLCIFLVLAISALANGQQRIFIVPMTDGFDSFLAAALISNHVPVVITMDEPSAAYVIVGNAVRGQNHWYDTVFGDERDRDQGSLRLIRVSDRSVVWAGAAGDRSLWWGSLKSGGQKKVANRLARLLKENYFDGATVIDANRNASSDLTKDPALISASLAPKTSVAPSTVKAGFGTADLLIKSVPDGAEITVDGKPAGTTPAPLTLVAGEHTIVIKKTGFKTISRFVRLERGSSTTLDATLE
jgi:hypothetical protein